VAVVLVLLQIQAHLLVLAGRLSVCLNYLQAGGGGGAAVAPSGSEEMAALAAVVVKILQLRAVLETLLLEAHPKEVLAVIGGASILRWLPIRRWLVAQDKLVHPVSTTVAGNGGNGVAFNFRVFNNLCWRWRWR
jgi:hypothetical protein